MTKKSSKKADLDAEFPVQDWHPADIKAALNKAGYTLSSLAEEVGLKSGSMLSKALTLSYPKSERTIADALGVLPQIIWPSRYEADGTRKLQGFQKLESSRRSKRLQAQTDGEQA
ncbi:MAG: helix-turn-helix transcriptional regulator [Spirochaetota bacterium]